MRTQEEMLELIMKKALEDDRIRAVALDGSRANKNAVHDRYSDFDIVYFVKDVCDFTQDKSWIEYFGELLIVQYPTDWYSHPYNYEGNDAFTYLMQFEDGNRIDLTLVDIRNIAQEAKNKEPRVILLNKDGYKELVPIENEEAYFMKRPSEMEFYNTCNEFRWLSVYISKGLCREEFYYARYSFEVLWMDMFLKMLNWKIAVENNFKANTGGHSKYLKRYLTKEEMARFQSIFPEGTYLDMWDKLFLAYDYFSELAAVVAGRLGFPNDEQETVRVRAFLEKRRAEK